VNEVRLDPRLVENFDTAGRAREISSIRIRPNNPREGIDLVVEDVAFFIRYYKLRALIITSAAHSGASMGKGCSSFIAASCAPEPCFFVTLLPDAPQQPRLDDLLIPSANGLEYAIGSLLGDTGVKRTAP